MSYGDSRTHDLVISAQSPVGHDINLYTQQPLGGVGERGNREQPSARLARDENVKVAARMLISTNGGAEDARVAEPVLPDKPEELFAMSCQRYTRRFGDAWCHAPMVTRGIVRRNCTIYRTPALHSSGSYATSHRALTREPLGAALEIPVRYSA